MSSLRLNYRAATNPVNNGVFNFEEHLIEQGFCYAAGFVDEDISGNGTIIEFCATTGSTPVRQQQIVGASTSTDVLMEIFAGTIYTGGTQIPSFNVNGQSSNTAGTTIFLNPTVTDDGVKTAPDRVLRGSGNLIGIELSSDADDSLFLFPPLSPLMFRFTNRASAGGEIFDLYTKFCELPPITI